MNTGKVWCGIFVLVAMASFARPALAQSEAQKKQAAKAHWEKAARLYDLLKYGEAIQEYEEAYLLVPEPEFLYNMGQAYRLWDKPDDALRCYKNYLRNRADAPNRAEVERRIAELEKTVEERRRTGTAPPPPQPPPATDTSAASTPPVAPPVVEPPPTPPAGATTTPDRPAATVVETPPSWSRKNSRVISYALFSAGGACLVTALVTGAVAVSKAKQIADASKNHQVFDPSVQSSGKKYNAVAVVTGVTGLALGGAGLYFYLRSGHKAESSGTANTRVSLFPLASPGFAGGGASVNF
jgi:tetratricopeptide (TPR) repeat protein